MLISTRHRILTAALLASLAAQVTAQDWPSFRGPGGSGVGTGSPPIRWNVETGENIKWKVRIPGLGHSSPVVWGDRIFVTTAVSSTAAKPELRTGWLNGSGESAADSGEWAWKVLCVDKNSGRIVWEQDANVGVLRMRSLPNFWLHASCDHAVVTRMLPAGPRKTRMKSYWLVHRDAREGDDYQLDRLLPFWHLTNEQDWEICKWQQKGVESIGYEPGPLSQRKEYNVDAFIRWYLKAMRKD